MDRLSACPLQQIVNARDNQQFIAMLLQMNQTLVGVHHLLQIYIFVYNMNERILGIIVLIHLHQFFQFHLAFDYQSSKDTTREITPVRNKIYFSWRNNNMSIYKPFSHQHVPEIKQSLKQLQNSFDAEIDFIPYRGDFPRGIFATLVIKCKVELEELVKMYQDYYAEDSFVHIVDKNIDLKQVVNTNKCLIHLEKHGDKLLVISCIDNLLKGASGQAVHNMNLMFNLEETVGLKLKPSAF